MAATTFLFEDCELDSTRFELRRGGVVQKVEPLVFDVLCYLVQRHGQFVGRDELHDAVWQGRVVSDSTIAGTIKAVRRAIGDDGKAQRLVKTVRSRGFSFVGPVSSSTDASTSMAIAHGEPPPQRGAMLSADEHLCDLLNGDAPESTAESNLLSHREALRAPLEASGGKIIGMAGGGVTAWFDDAGDAVACAARLLQAATRRRGPDGAGPALGPRVGICERDADPGHAAALAARLQCLAAPGEICITGAVEEAALGQHAFSSKRIEANDSGVLDALGLSIVQAVAPSTASTSDTIPQLRCGSPVPPREPSVVIVPFQPLGSDEQAAELAEGLRIDIQNALVKVSRITLIAAGSANAFRGKSPESAASALGVRYVLSGLVQIVAARARVSLELIDTVSMRARWTEQFDVSTRDTFAIQDDISRKVLDALEVKLYGGEQARVWHQVLTEPKIVRTFYRGVSQFFKMDRDAMARARQAFVSVAQMRPESSIGATWAALSHWVDHTRHWGDQATSRHQAKHWAKMAGGLPDADGQAHTVLAHVQLLDREFDAALAAGRQALELRPGCANANGFFGNLLHYCGDQPEAIRRIRRGIRLQPIYPPFFAGVLATAYLANGQPESALAVGKEALRLNSADVPARLLLLAAAHRTGAATLAARFRDEILQRDPTFSVAAYGEAQPYRTPVTLTTLSEAWRAVGLPA